MGTEKLQDGHILTLNTNQNNLLTSRRKFIFIATLMPLSYLFSTRDANAFLPLLVRLFARPAIRKIATRGTTKKIREFSRPPSRITYSKDINTKIKVSDAVKVINTAKDAIDLAQLLEKTIWETSSSNNKGSIIIDNTDSSANINTGDINIELKDTSNKNVDFTATIAPITIPAKSRLVLDMNFRELSEPGIKRIHGTYGENNEAAHNSGDILVLENARKKLKGRTVDDLYNEYDEQLKSKYILG